VREEWLALPVARASMLQRRRSERIPSRQNADLVLRDPRRPRVCLGSSAAPAVPPLGVEKILSATADQVAYALVEGERELLLPAALRVKPLIAVRVPTETGLGFDLVDSRTEPLLNGGRLSGPANAADA